VLTALAGIETFLTAGPLNGDLATRDGKAAGMLWERLDQRFRICACPKANESLSVSNASFLFTNPISSVSGARDDLGNHWPCKLHGRIS
jgi:hypothetical protein